jgi:hypothetical protein
MVYCPLYKVLEMNTNSSSFLCTNCELFFEEAASVYSMVRRVLPVLRNRGRGWKPKLRGNRDVSKESQRRARQDGKLRTVHRERERYQEVVRMSVCMHKCVNTCACVCVCVRAWPCEFVCIYVCIYVCMNLCVGIHACFLDFWCMYVCIAYVYMCVCVPICD